MSDVSEVRFKSQWRLSYKSLLVRTRLLISRNSFRLSMASKDTHISIVDDISVLATRAATNDQQYLNGEEGYAWLDVR